MHSTALFFCVLFSAISNHFFAQFLCKRKLFIAGSSRKVFCTYF